MYGCSFINCVEDKVRTCISVLCNDPKLLFYQTEISQKNLS